MRIIRKYLYKTLEDEFKHETRLFKVQNELKVTFEKCKEEPLDDYEQSKFRDSQSFDSFSDYNSVLSFCFKVMVYNERVFEAKDPNDF